MGLYSTNRVVQLAMNESATKFENNIDLAKYVDESAPNLLEASIMLTEAENKMFDTLIGLDFAEAMHEQAMLEADDASNDSDKSVSNAASSSAKKSAIVEKIKSFITNAIQSIATAVKRAVAKIQGFISDKANAAVIGKAANLQPSEIAKFRAHANFVRINPNQYKSTLSSIQSKFKSVIDAAETKFNGEASADAVNDSFKEIEDQIANFNSANTKKDESGSGFDLSWNEDVKPCIEVLKSGKGIIGEIEKVGKTAIASFKQLSDKMDKAVSEDEQKAAARASFTTSVVKKITNFTTQYMNAYIHVLSYARKVVIMGVNGSKHPDEKKNDEETKTESGYANFLADVSDFFCENYFEY